MVIGAPTPLVVDLNGWRVAITNSANGKVMTEWAFG